MTTPDTRLPDLVTLNTSEFTPLLNSSHICKIPIENLGISFDMSTVGLISSLLPELPGVKPLTRNEIKRDISLIESFYDSDNSDASVSSSEAIPSTYPVKPRNFTKLQKRDDALLLQARDVPHSHIHVGGGMSVDDTIEFMKAVETARPDIYAGEKERENLEIRYQALREMSISQSESFLRKKKEQKNFIRVVQGVCRNRCQYYDVLSQKNSMLHDLIASLQHKKHHLQFFESSLALLEQRGGKTSACAGNSKQQQQQTAGSEQQGGAFYFHKHQCVSTPMGQGVIASINPAAETVTIRLPFGVMHSSFASVVSWHSAATARAPLALGGGALPSLDVHHVDSLRHRWTKEFASLSQVVGMSETRDAEITQLLRADKLATALAARGGAEAVPAARGKAGRAATSAKTRPGSRAKVLAHHDPEVAPAPGAQSSSNNNGNSSNARIESSKRSIYLDQTKKLPLLFCPPGLAPYLASSYGGDYVTGQGHAKARTCASSTILPQRAGSLVSTGAGNLQAEYCLKAFQRNVPVSFFCNTKGKAEVDAAHGEDEEVEEEGTESVEEDSFSEEKNGLLPGCRFEDFVQQVADLKDNLRPILNKIKECRKRKRSLAIQVENAKMSTAQISQQISKIRLGMFTRRVLHRQNCLARVEREKCQLEAANMVRESPPAPASAAAPPAAAAGSPPPPAAPEKDKTKLKGRDKEKDKDKKDQGPAAAARSVGKDKADKDKVVECVAEHAVEEAQDSQSSGSRRKSTRAAVVATTASSESQVSSSSSSSSRGKRKKEEGQDEEAEAPAPPPAAAPAAAVSVAPASAKAAAANGSAAAKRNAKRVKR